MAANRWKNLDFEPLARERETVGPNGGETAQAGTREAGAGFRAQGSEEGGPAVAGTLNSSPTARVPALNPEPPRPHDRSNAEPPAPEVAQARGAYLLRNYQAVVDLLEPLLRDRPALPGGQRILAQALARLDREPEAEMALREAIHLSSSDWLARASLSSLLLRSRAGEGTASPASEGVIQLEAALISAPEEARPALRELLGAACWRAGQDDLRDRRDCEAAAQFEASGQQFVAAATASAAARLALPPRQAAAFVGQAVALLLAGQHEAAQRLFSRTPLPGTAAAASLGRFASGLYELCDALAHVPAGERSAAAAALREVVLQSRLEVVFYDGRQAVSLAWVGGIR